MGLSFTFRRSSMIWNCVALLICCNGSVGDAADNLTSNPKSRSFTFFYGATINELAPGSKAKVWLPVASSDHDQTVELLVAQTPGSTHFTTEREFGNKLIYFEAVADARGEIVVDVEYKITRRELSIATAEAASDGAPEHLKSSSMIPVDGRLLRTLVDDQTVDGDNLAGIRKLYDAVDDLMSYEKPIGKPWGRGDALWACDAHYGNCTDFHSIFIGACRDLHVPAKFEMGFSIPEKYGEGEISGYHCWAKFIQNGRWIPVDISEADKNPMLKDYYFGNLNVDRVKFSEGREFDLEPRSELGKVNFLVYPHVEVNGQVHTKFVKRFRYADLSN